MEEQVCVIYAGTRGYLDKVDVKEVGRFEKELLNSPARCEARTCSKIAAEKPSRRD
jgi:F-type H+-transporting ATPase subunit alpha